MNLILSIPLEVRLGVLLVLGACIGSLANMGVYRLAWRPRWISPWSPSGPDAPPRRPTDRVPILGWLGLRREAGIHGRGFWFRPMLVEVLCGVGFAALYWWEVERHGLLPPGLFPPEMPGPLPGDWLVVLHVQYAAHVALFALMLVASLIDVDEQIIPDTVTVPGMLVGLLVAAVLPWSLLPVPDPVVGIVEFMRLTTPCAWPLALDGFPHATSLAAGLGCWWFWCVALLPRSWYARHGWRRAVQLCCARLVRETATSWILLMGAIGSGVVAAVWYGGALSWAALLSALVGAAAGCGSIWAVRIISKAALKREAMGFGDVTLMAMIGAFLGWQACLLVFFLAPLAGLVVGVPQLVLSRNNQIPYGPFLCLAAAAVVVFWAAIWDRAWVFFDRVFELGWIMPLIVVACMAVMALLLSMMRLIRGPLR